MSNDTKTNRLTRMSKRRFLKTLAGLGISGTTLQYMTKDTLASITNDPTKRVPRLERFEHTNHEELVQSNYSIPPERKPVYYTVPRDEWIWIEAPYSGAELLKEQLKTEIDTTLIKVGVTDIVSGHQTKKAIVVGYDILETVTGDIQTPNISYSELVEILPASITARAVADDPSTVMENIPVITDKNKISQTAYFDYRYDRENIPGGVAMECGANDKLGTMCYYAYDNDIDHSVFITAGHVLHQDITGYDDCYQPNITLNLNTYIGDAHEWNSQSNVFDAGTIRIGSTVTPTPYIGGDGGPNDLDWNVHGSLAWDKIKEKPDMYFQGRSTGRHHTHVKEVYDNRTFWLEKEGGRGDSGGPMFSVIGGVAYIAGVVGWRSGHDTGGTYIRKVEDRYNIIV